MAVLRGALHCDSTLYLAAELPCIKKKGEDLPLGGARISQKWSMLWFACQSEDLNLRRRNVAKWLSFTRW